MKHFSSAFFLTRRRAAGFSMVEVVLSIGLLAMLASALFVYLGTQLVGITESRRSLDAIELSQEGLEASRSIRDLSWSSFTTGTHGLASSNGSWVFQGTSDVTSEFTRVISVSDLSADERQVVSTVSWQISPGRTRTTSLTTNVSNWRNVAQAVLPRLSGDWTNPQTLGTIDLGAGIQATGIAVRNKLVYMSGIASNSSKSDFFVINATDGRAPSVAASIDTGSGLHAVAVVGSFAYAAADDPTNQLQILNISATSSPMAIRNFHLVGNNESALSVAATGTLVLVGTERDAGPELFFVDVSNPSSPLTKSTIDVGGSVNRIFILGNQAFLGTSSSTSEFMVVDITNPNVPVVIAHVNLPGSNAATGLYVNSQDHRAYITRDQATGISPEINVYDVTHPEAPALLGAMEFGSPTPAVFAADALLFLGTNVSNLEFQIFTSTDPQNMPFVSGLNFPQYVNDMMFEDNILYVALRSNDALRIITSQ